MPWRPGHFVGGFPGAAPAAGGGDHDADPRVVCEWGGLLRGQGDAWVDVDALSEDRLIQGGSGTIHKNPLR